LESLYSASELTYVQDHTPGVQSLLKLRNQRWAHLKKQTIKLASLYDKSGTE
jgi:hypothetical protein